MKKLISLFLSVLLILSVAYVSVTAETYGVFTYTVSNNEVTITKCDTSASGVVEIPATIGDYPVVALDNKSFNDCKNITEVIVPEGVTHIGEGAFGECIALESVTLPSSLTNLGSGAFLYCISLKEINIPEKVETINDVTFMACRDLEKVVMSDGVKTIGVDAFSSCPSLTTVQFSDSLTKIGKNAFYGCKALKKVCLPESLEQIGECAFCYCSSVNLLIMPEGVETIDATAFYGCTALKQVNIPKSVTTIGKKAFGYDGTMTELEDRTIDGFKILGSPSTQAQSYAESNGLEFVDTATLEPADFEYSITKNGVVITRCIVYAESLEIPETIVGYPVVEIGEGAFYGCRSKEIIIPDSVEKIGNNAFDGCELLASVELPDSLTEIGSKAFYGCDSLKALDLPDGLKTIGEKAFYSCDGIKEVTIPKSVTTIGDKAFGYHSIYSINGLTDKLNNNFKITGYSSSEAQRYAENNRIVFIDIENFEPSDFECNIGTESVEIIGYNGSDEKVEIPSELYGRSVVSISSEAFRGCTFLKEVIIPDSVTMIMPYVFADCTSLEYVRLPDLLEAVNSYLFYNCTSLKEIEVYSGLVVNSAFENCVSLEKIEFGYRVGAVWQTALEGCKALKSVTVINDDTYIEDNAIGYYTEGEELKKIEDLVIYGYNKSNAMEYAQKNGFTFVSLDKKEEPTTNAPTQTPSTITPDTTISPEATTPTTTAPVIAQAKKPSKIKKVKVVYSKKRQVVVKWQKDKNAKKYVVKYSYKKNMKGAKTKTVKTTKVTLKKLKKGKRIYVQVQGVNNKLKGKWSKKISKKVK